MVDADVSMSRSQELCTHLKAHATKRPYVSGITSYRLVETECLRCSPPGDAPDRALYAILIACEECEPEPRDMHVQFLVY